MKISHELSEAEIAVCKKIDSITSNLDEDAFEEFFAIISDYFYTRTSMAHAFAEESCEELGITLDEAQLWCFAQ